MKYGMPWSLMSVQQRLPFVKKLRQILAERVELFIAALRLPHRNNDVESISGELIPLGDACAFLEKRAISILKPRSLRSKDRPLWLWGVDAEIHREPLGTVLVLGPGNYPLMLPGIQIIQALVAGNRVIFKPAPSTRAIAKLFSDAVHDSGVPNETMVLLDESPAAIQSWLPSVDKVVLTGSESTGKRVLADLADKLIPSVMELSGCDAVFVVPGADLDRVTESLHFGLTFNSSATCLAPRRVFVDQSLAEPLIVKLRNRLVAGGRPFESPAAIQFINELGNDAITQGAELLFGKLPFDPAQGPLVFDYAKPEMRILQEDIMSPHLAIVRIASSDEAIAAYDKCRYQLGASVFGEENTARNLAHRISAGSIVINDIVAPTVDPRLPFGGRKRSGFGVTRGAEGLLEMTQVKTISVRHGKPLHLHPRADQAGPLMLAYFKAAHGGGLQLRLHQWFNVFREGRKLFTNK